MMWNPRIETMPLDKIKEMQRIQLKKLVNNLYSFNRFYHDRMKEANVSPLDINTLEDIQKLPFMYKQDLRDNYPDKMFTVDKSEIVRYHMSSGTSGKPTCVAYTRNDLDYWTEALARSLTAAGLTSDDTIQIAYGYGLFTGGLGLHYGAERIGATVLPASTGNTQRQLEMMQDLQCTAIACTPSYLTHLITTARQITENRRMHGTATGAILSSLSFFSFSYT